MKKYGLAISVVALAGALAIRASEGKYGVYCYTEKQWLSGLYDTRQEAEDAAASHKRNSFYPGSTVLHHTVGAYTCNDRNENCSKVLN